MLYWNKLVAYVTTLIVRQGTPAIIHNKHQGTTYLKSGYPREAILSRGGKQDNRMFKI